MKICKKCGLEKDFSEFHKSKNGAMGFASRCKDCLKTDYLKKIESSKNLNVELPELVTCLKCKIQKNIDLFYKYNYVPNGYVKTCIDCMSISRTSSNHNISEEQYLSMIKDGCEVCGSFERLCVDHDHSCCQDTSKSCGKCIRGILCNKCNTAEGMLNSDRLLARRMVEYIEKHAR